MQKTKTPRVAIVADWLTNFAGAERVVLEMTRIFPEAVVFTTIFAPENLPDDFRKLDVRTTFLNRWPGAQQRWHRYLWAMPTAIESLDLDEFDIVISSSQAVAHGVVTRPETLHVNYCHTPMRYAWDGWREYLARAPFGEQTKKIVPWVLTLIRAWDRVAADRPDAIVSNSDFVGRRIAKFYRRESTTIHPPVDTDRFTKISKSKSENFVTVGRLVSYKRTDLLVEAFAKMPEKKLVVIGDGPELGRLKSLAGANVDFRGRVSEEERDKLLRDATAFLFPTREDFGIAPVEAMAAGTPVIALGVGGALETVAPGVSGEFFPEQTVDAIVEAVQKFDPAKFDAKKVRAHAEKFSKKVFRQKFKKFVDEKWRDFGKKV